jgi:tRNA pseudouridine13 synthase
MTLAPASTELLETWVPPVTHADLPATGGKIGRDVEDFRVDEVPLYERSGQGEHLWLRVEKRGLTTPQLLGILAKASGTRERDIGAAGMKDKHAVTSQWFSMLAAQARPVETWELPEQVKVLEVTRHANKLRTGHLRGNRFSVRLVNVEHPSAAQALAERLQQAGIPNYFGAQRFGQRQDNLTEALAWLRETKRGKRGHFYEKLYPSVIQSEVFNRTLGRRQVQSPNRVLEGDVVRLAGSTRHFIVEDAEKEQPRLDQRDILLTGPMLGPKMLQPRGAAKDFEASVQAELGLNEEELERLGHYAPGTRRDAISWPEELSVEVQGPDCLLVAFTLDAGSYATQVIREFTHAPFGQDGRTDSASPKTEAPEAAS